MRAGSSYQPMMGDWFFLPQEQIVAWHEVPGLKFGHLEAYPTLVSGLSSDVLSQPSKGERQCSRRYLSFDFPLVGRKKGEGVRTGIKQHRICYSPLTSHFKSIPRRDAAVVLPRPTDCPPIRRSLITPDRVPAPWRRTYDRQSRSRHLRLTPPHRDDDCRSRRAPRDDNQWCGRS